MDPREQFIVELYPAARQVSRETGMSWQTILAQAAQETGWGQHQLAGTHNIFSIKADGSWHGPAKTFNVWEIEHGRKVWLDQSFRVYGSYEEALRDRVKFLEDNPRYAKAGLFDKGVKGNLKQEAEALQKAGYATDPLYAESLIRVFDSPLMQRAIATAEFHERAAGPRTVPIGTAHSVDVPMLHKGDRGDAVRVLQLELHELGYMAAGEVDGRFGPHTRAAVERFQHDRGLAVDGIVGDATRRQLHADLRVHRNGVAEFHRTAGSSVAPGDFSDPSHPRHAMYAHLRSLLPPGTSQERLHQATAACHLAGIHVPEDLEGINDGKSSIVFMPNNMFGRATAMDLGQPAPSVLQTMQQVQAFDQQQIQLSRQVHQQEPSGPSL